jgi:hypothetical protein
MHPPTPTSSLLLSSRHQAFVIRPISSSFLPVLTFVCSLRSWRVVVERDGQSDARVDWVSSDPFSASTLKHADT